jgi:Flp pilus assembly protein TadD
MAPALPPNQPTADDASLLARYRTALERDPGDAETLYETGQVLLRRGRVDEALGPLRQAAALRSDQWREAFVFGYAAAVRQRWPDAMAAFQRANGLSPSDPVIGYNLALVSQKVGDYRAAAERYAASIELDASSAQAHLGLAISLDRLHQTAQALSAYRQAASRMGAGPDAERIEARIRTLEELGKTR